MTPNVTLPGFDTEDALDRFGGNSTLLLKYVALMIEDFEQRLPTLAALLTAHDFKQAKLVLHTMVGTASALSATQLMSLCIDCESLCQQELQEQTLKSFLEIQCFLDTIRQSL